MLSRLLHQLHLLKLELLLLQELLLLYLLLHLLPLSLSHIILLNDEVWMIGRLLVGTSIDCLFLSSNLSIIIMVVSLCSRLATNRWSCWSYPRYWTHIAYNYSTILHHLLVYIALALPLLLTRWCWLLLMLLHRVHLLHLLLLWLHLLHSDDDQSSSRISILYKK